jgi:hypothetical protein
LRRSIAVGWCKILLCVPHDRNSKKGPAGPGLKFWKHKYRSEREPGVSLPKNCESWFSCHALKPILAAAYGP